MRRCLQLAMSALLAACGNSDPSPVRDLDAGVDDVAAIDASDATTTLPDASLEAGPVGLPTGRRDRAGRPLVSRMLVAPINQDAIGAVEEPFLIDTSTRVPGSPTTVGLEMVRRLTTADGFDGKKDFSSTTTLHPLLDIVAFDGLRVDPDKPFSPSSFLDLEVNGAAHTTCGGRWPGDDAVDKMLSFMANGSVSGVSDGVDSPASPPTTTFPYLAPPH